jgi:hypothetical protein
MESYRGLGSHIVGKLCGSLETARTAPGGRLDIEALAHSVTCYLESTRAADAPRRVFGGVGKAQRLLGAKADGGEKAKRQQPGETGLEPDARDRRQEGEDRRDPKQKQAELVDLITPISKGASLVMITAGVNEKSGGATNRNGSGGQIKTAGPNAFLQAGSAAIARPTSVAAGVFTFRS